MKREATLKERVATLEKEIGVSDAALSTQLAELREELNHREVAHNQEISALRQELDEKEELISIQGKVIDLLDDAGAAGHDHGAWPGGR